MKLQIKVEGLDRLIRKCKTHDWIAEPWRDMYRKALELVVQRGKSRAPRRTGRMAASITSRLDPRPVPLWGIVTANAESHGVRYPWVLNAGWRSKKGSSAFSAKSSRKLAMMGYGRTANRWGLIQKAVSETGTVVVLHYAGGQRKTRRWLVGALYGSKRQIQELVMDAGRKMEAAWPR